MANTIEFIPWSETLLLVYSPQDEPEWLIEKLADEATHRIQNTFTVCESDIVETISDANSDIFDFSLSDDSKIRFKIAVLRDSYWEFNKTILSISYDLKIHNSIILSRKHFTAVKNISIFRRIDRVIDSKFLTIGGNAESEEWLSEEEFQHMISIFPNSYELDRYANARVSSVLKERFETKHDDELRLHNYVNKKLTGKPKAKIFESIEQYEINKYSDLHAHLTRMLDDEHEYREHDWQNEIVKFILLLFPKYLYAFTEAPVFDAQFGKVRALDFLLVDSTGNVDIVEIKKPFDKGLITDSGYRDNYIPREGLINVRIFQIILNKCFFQRKIRA